MIVLYSENLQAAVPNKKYTRKNNDLQNIINFMSDANYISL